MLADKVTCLIFSCDKFSDLWDGNLKLFRQNWPDRDFKTYIVTDKPTGRKFPDVEIIAAGADVEWSDRLRFALNFVKTDYVFVTLDDYFLIKKVDNTRMEHLIELMIHNAEEALSEACRECGVEVTDYTVAPVFMDESHAKGAHQWVVEFSPASQERMSSPQVQEHFRSALDAALCRRNSDYEAKRSGDVTMTELELTPVPPGTFYRWMESRGKTGGQNKVPRLSNDRRFVEQILNTVDR